MRKHQTNDEYHADKSHFSNSDLQMMGEWDGREVEWTPHRFRAHINGSLIRKEKEHFDLGSALHCLLIEPDEYGNRYFVVEDAKPRSKAGKAELCAMSLNHYGKVAISTENHQKAMSWAQTAFAHPYWPKEPPLRVEESIYWTDDKTGIPLKARPDAEYEQFSLDIKTTTHATLRGFMRSAGKFGYHRQAALYREGLERESSLIGRLIHVVVSKAEPPTCWFVEFQQAAYRLGWAQTVRTLKQIKLCQDAACWLPDTDIVTGRLPQWYYPKGWR